MRGVWDLPVRIVHWTLVLAVVGAYVTDRIGVAAFRYHVWCGYTVLVLVAFRVIWGVLGTRHARFWNFVCGPVRTWRYVRDLLHGQHRLAVGHNPLGALMVLFLLAALAAQAVTGLFGNDEIFNLGPLYGYVSNERSLQLTGLHRRLFYWIAGAVALHVLAVLLHRWRYGEDLVLPMVTGRKSAALVPAEQAISGSRIALALLLLALLIALLSWIVLHAPEPAALDSFN